MGALSRWLSRFCYRHPKLSVPNLMRYIAVGNVFVFLMDLVSGNTFSAVISFVPAYIFRGQIWRLITFIFVPVSGSPIFFLLSLLLYYFLGTQLERTWGSTKFTVYYAMGVLLNVVVGLLLGLTAWRGFAVVNMYYVNMSLFFAFATLYPDTQFMVYFIIPVKVKWLAWLDAALFAAEVIRCLAAGEYLLSLVPVAAVVNYLLFFWDEIAVMLRLPRREGRRRGGPVDLKTARRKLKDQQGYLHKCAVCGLTDADDPNMEFRYCSRCNGYYCYCADHINSHVHIQ